MIYDQASHGEAYHSHFSSTSAEYGSFECLKYAHENGFTWDEWTCKYAAQNGHLECLKYAHQNGCPWDEWTCKYAAQNGHLECLKYYENNCFQ